MGNVYYTGSLTPSSGVAKAINVLATSGTITLTDNSCNSLTPTGDIIFTPPTVTDNTIYHQILVQINLTSVVNFDYGTSNHYFNGVAPDLSAVGKYNLIYEYDKAESQWYCGAVKKGVAS